MLGGTLRHQQVTGGMIVAKWAQVSDFSQTKSVLTTAGSNPVTGGTSRRQARPKGVATMPMQDV